MYTDYQQQYSAMVNQSDAERNSAMDQLLNKYRFEQTQDLSEAETKDKERLEVAAPLGVEFFREGVMNDTMQKFGKKVLSNALKMGYNKAKTSSLLKGGNLESVLNSGENLYNSIDKDDIAGSLDRLVQQHGPAIRQAFATKEDAVKAFGERMGTQLKSKVGEAIDRAGTFAEDVGSRVGEFGERAGAIFEGAAREGLGEFRIASEDVSDRVIASVGRFKNAISEAKAVKAAARASKIASSTNIELQDLAGKIDEKIKTPARDIRKAAREAKRMVSNRVQNASDDLKPLQLEDATARLQLKDGGVGDEIYKSPADLSMDTASKVIGKEPEPVQVEDVPIEEMGQPQAAPVEAANNLALEDAPAGASANVARDIETPIEEIARPIEQDVPEISRIINTGGSALEDVAEDVASTGSKSFFGQLFEGALVADAADAEIPGLDLVTGAITAAAGVGTLLTGIFDKAKVAVPELPKVLQATDVSSTFGA